MLGFLIFLAVDSEEMEARVPDGELPALHTGRGLSRRVVLEGWLEARVVKSSFRWPP
jgi:hypothetical protein